MSREQPSGYISNTKLNYKKIKEIVTLLESADLSDEEYDQLCRDLNEEMGSTHREALFQLAMKGPTYDGNVISKSARDDLMDWGLANRVCIRGEQGFTGANYLGWNVLKAVVREKEYSLERKSVPTIYALINPEGQQVKVGTLDEATNHLPKDIYSSGMWNALFYAKTGEERRTIFQENGWRVKRGIFLEDQT